MKLESNSITENFTELFSDFEAPEGWRKVLKPTDVFKMINSQMDIGMFCVKIRQKSKQSLSKPFSPTDYLYS